MGRHIAQSLSADPHEMVEQYQRAHYRVDLLEWAVECHMRGDYIEADALAHQYHTRYTVAYAVDLARRYVDMKEELTESELKKVEAMVWAAIADNIIRRRQQDMADVVRWEQDEFENWLTSKESEAYTIG